MWTVIGQARAVTLLKRSLETDSLAHAYLLTGPEHVGKSLLAINLAQALNCTGAEPPCGECSSCRRISEDKHADVRRVRLLVPMTDEDAPQRTRISIKDFDEIEYAANLPPYEGRRKVFIIDGAENLSAAAGNRLLKVLEEPFPHVIWLLLTSQERRLLPTVASRCQRIELPPIPVAEVARVLCDLRLEPAKAGLLAQLSRGCLGWAILASSDGSLLEARSREMDRLVSLLSAGMDERFQTAWELGGVLDRDRKAGMEILNLWLGWWRDALLLKMSCPEAVTNSDYLKSLEDCAGRRLTLSQIKETIESIRNAMTEVGRNVSGRLALEVLMLNMVKVDQPKSVIKEGVSS
jgi:DNA polymerase-3 subunit delta'